MSYYPNPHPDNPIVPNLSWLPFGFSWADGTHLGSADFNVGTPTPPWAIVQQGGNGDGSYFEELPDSPKFSRGEQMTCVHTWECDQVTASVIMSVCPRGTVFIDTFDPLSKWKVLETSSNRKTPNTWVVQIISESITFDLPPDEFSIEVVEFNPSLTKHPRYAPLTKTMLYYINAYSQSQDFLRVMDFSNILTTLNGTQNRAKTELLFKLKKGIDSFYLAGFKINYSFYSYLPYPIDPGGRVEDPVSNGIIPYFFWSLDGTPSTDPDNISFSSLASSVSPILYGNGLTYLRLADTDYFQRTWHRITKSWIAAPAGGPVLIEGNPYNWKGHWDEDIYQSGVPDGVVYDIDPNQ